MAVAACKPQISLLSLSLFLFFAIMCFSATRLTFIWCIIYISTISFIGHLCFMCLPFLCVCVWWLMTDLQNRQTTIPTSSLHRFSCFQYKVFIKFKLPNRLVNWLISFLQFFFKSKKERKTTDISPTFLSYDIHHLHNMFIGSKKKKIEWNFMRLHFYLS